MIDTQTHFQRGYFPVISDKNARISYRIIENRDGTGSIVLDRLHARQIEIDSPVQMDVLGYSTAVVHSNIINSRRQRWQVVDAIGQAAPGRVYGQFSIIHCLGWQIATPDEEIHWRGISRNANRQIGSFEWNLHEIVEPGVALDRDILRIIRVLLGFELNG